MGSFSFPGVPRILCVAVERGGWDGSFVIVGVVSACRMAVGGVSFMGSFFIISAVLVGCVADRGGVMGMKKDGGKPLLGFPPS